VKPCRLVIDPDYQPARSIVLDPRSLTLVEGQRSTKGLTITVNDRTGSPPKADKLTPRMTWRDPKALAALPGLQEALTAALARPKLIEGSGSPAGTVRFEVTFPEVTLSETERTALAARLPGPGQGGVVGPYRFPILVQVPGALDAEFLLGVEPRQDS